jgi:predicted MFS family arabinose efflux permease
MLFASLTAGWLWESYGSEFTFYCGAVFSFLALSILAIRHTLRLEGQK